ncbi:MAG: benzil reductase ((S)-benzoin forming) [Gammaproteobacteria bacterium]|jgi:benzil reductase ((S)-benzoin forming)
MKRVWIVSGASRGIGAAIVSAAQAQGDYVIGIARGESAADLSIKADFTDPAQATLPGLPFADQYILVNNAGLIDPVGTQYTADQAACLVNVNLTSAIMLSREFLARVQNLDAKKLIVNLSSGAATNAKHGWSLYCASKAGLDHFGRCVALEQQSEKYPVDVLGLSPGAVDTEMQAVLRSADSDAFPGVEQFREFKENGVLSSPESIAERLLARLEQEWGFGGDVIRVTAL